MAKAIVDGLEFLKTWEASNSVGEVAAKLGMKIGSVQAKASKFRTNNIPLKAMPRGNGGGRHKVDHTQFLSVLASIRNVTVEELTQDASVQAALRATRAVARNAKKAAAKMV